MKDTGAEVGTGRKTLLAGLTKNDLIVLGLLSKDAEADMLFRGCKGMGDVLSMTKDAVSDSIDALQLRGIVRKWVSPRGLQSLEIVPTGQRIIVPERRGVRCCSKKVSRETTGSPGDA